MSQAMQIFKAEDWPDTLFAMLSAMYLKRWTSNFPNPESIEQWKVMIRISFVGVSSSKLTSAIVKCTERFPDWPPTMGELKELVFSRSCADPESAYIEAIQQLNARRCGNDKWSHPSVFWAAQRFGSFDLLQSNWQQAKTRWTKLYTDALNESLPEIQVSTQQALPAPGQTSISQEEARERAAKIIDMLARRMAVA